jgi:hypothetical protein
VIRGACVPCIPLQRQLQLNVLGQRIAVTATGSAFTRSAGRRGQVEDLCISFCEAAVSGQAKIIDKGGEGAVKAADVRADSH